MTDVVEALPLVTDTVRARILEAERTTDAHTALMTAVPSMSSLEVGGVARRSRLPERCGVAAWNVERCLFPEASAQHLVPHEVDVILLSEMDRGMARILQRNTTRIMAEALGMTYAYVVEFYEMDLGGETERALRG